MIFTVYLRGWGGGRGGSVHRYTLKLLHVKKNLNSFVVKKNEKLLAATPLIFECSGFF